LLPDSPCIDAGDPESFPDPDGTRSDIGIYFFDQSSEIAFYAFLEKSYYPQLDSLRFGVFFSNGTDTSIQLQGWTEVETPDGLVISPTLGPIGALIGADRYIYSSYYQHIPGYTPYGSPYTYRVKIGEYPDVILAQDSLKFTIGPPRVKLLVEPDTTIYHRGETFSCTASITNREDITVNLQIWSDVETPSGHTISPVYGPIGRQIEPQATLMQHINQQVPNNAPFGGPYIYTVRIGTYEEEILGEDSFEFFIVPGLELPEQKYIDCEAIE